MRESTTDGLPERGAIVERVAIDAMTHGPDAVGRHLGKVVFVAGGAPGDLVDVEVVRVEPRFSRAIVRRVHSATPNRRQPECRYVGRCGGCQWQHLSYGAQLEAKHRNLLDNLVRIGGLVDAPVRPTLPSPSEWRYRHRINLRVDGRQLGFYRAESHDIVEIAACPIAAEPLERGLAAARTWLAAVRTTLRRLSLVTSEGTDGIVLVANAEGGFVASDDDLNEHTTRRAPGATIRGIVMFGRSWRRMWGDPAVAYTVDDISLVTTGGEFTQVNLAGNRLLVDTVLRLGRVGAGDRVLDLYCGAGNLTLPAARRGALVTGVERSPRAIADAIANAQRLAVDARFVCSPVEAVLADVGSVPRPLELVILDPPRGGAAGVVKEIARLSPRRIVYVSCDPPTLARDLATLGDHGFRPEAIQPIDLFPHTFHLEAVAALAAAR